MIGRLSGRIVQRGTEHVLIDVGGVGFVVQVSQRTRAGLPGTGQVATLWTELLVREDALTLVGFPTLVEKEWHRLLMTVQGVGSKAAMAILGTLGAEGIGRALALGDWSAIRAAPGVGPKTAQRVLMELKDKAPALMALAGEAEEEAGGGGLAPDAEPGSGGAAMRTASPPPRKARGAAQADTAQPVAEAGASQAATQADALSALVNLGYAPSEAVSAVARAAVEMPGAGMAALIRAALRLLAPGQ